MYSLSHLGPPQMRKTDPAANPRNLVLSKVQVIERQWRHQREEQDNNVTQRKEKRRLEKKFVTNQNVEDHKTVDAECRKSFWKPETEVDEPPTKTVDINLRRQQYKKSTSFRRIWAFKISNNDWCDDARWRVTRRHRRDVFEKTLLTFPPFRDKYIKFSFNGHLVTGLGWDLLRLSLFFLGTYEKFD